MRGLEWVAEEARGEMIPILQHDAMKSTTECAGRAGARDFWVWTKWLVFEAWIE